MAGVKLEQMPRTKKGYGIKARIPGRGAQTFRAPTVNEARRLAHRWVDEVESGKVSTSMEMTLAEYRTEVLPGMRWSPASRQVSESLWRTSVAPYLGGHPLSAITRPELRQWLTRLEAEGASAVKRQKVLALVRVLLKHALNDGRIAQVPSFSGLVERPRVRPGFALTPEQILDLAAGFPPRLRTVILVGATTGLRVGELLALRPEDIDESSNPPTISVRRAVKWGQSHGRRDLYVGPPKTAAGSRVVPTNDAVVNLLRSQIERFGLSTCPPSPDGQDGYIFTGIKPAGAWLTYNALNRYFAMVVDELVAERGFPRVRIHDLRKTYGSYMVANPMVTPMEAAQALGHRDPSMTLNVYARLIPGREALPAATAAMTEDLGLPTDRVEPAPLALAARPLQIPGSPYMQTCQVCGADFERETGHRRLYCSGCTVAGRKATDAARYVRRRRQTWEDALVAYAETTNR